MNEVDVNQTDLGGYIKRTLDEKHWSIRKAATKTGISASYLSRIINRKAIANPKSETLDKLANGLGVERDDVYTAIDKSVFPSHSVAGNADTFDIGKAIDNDQYMTNHGKQLTDKEKAMLKALFGE